MVEGFAAGMNPAPSVISSVIVPGDREKERRDCSTDEGVRAVLAGDLATDKSSNERRTDSDEDQGDAIASRALSWSNRLCTGISALPPVVPSGVAARTASGTQSREATSRSPTLPARHRSLSGTGWTAIVASLDAVDALTWRRGRRHRFWNDQPERREPVVVSGASLSATMGRPVQGRDAGLHLAARSAG